MTDVDLTLLGEGPDAVTVTTQSVPGVGLAPVRSLTPRENYTFGLFDVVAELAGVMVASGIIPAEGLRQLMLARAGIQLAEHGEHNASAARTLSEIAAIWAQPKALALPKDAEVVPFRHPEAPAARSQDGSSGADGSDPAPLRDGA